MTTETTTRASAAPAGVYIHWPFCARKCPYCDFYTFGREHPDFPLAERYATALLAEMESTVARLTKTARPTADTIYFGGGTPSLMPRHVLEKIVARVRDLFDLTAEAEITLEVNPTAAEAERFTAFAETGINRLSIGCQSFDDRFLRVLGRDHDAAEARAALERARAAGFDNLSLDIMFGLPDQTMEDFERDLAAALEFAPEHFSAYGLTYHPGTPFERWRREGRWTETETDPEGEMFEALIDRLADAGYEHYEISNWSRPGRESRHNSKYWRACDVYAFGVSAHGVVGGRRYAHRRDLRGYLDTWSPRPVNGTGAAGGHTAPASPLTAESLHESETSPAEIMMLALRRVPGVGWDELESWLSFDPRDRYRNELTQLREGGLLQADAERLRLTRRGILLADSVAACFFG